MNRKKLMKIIKMMKTPKILKAKTKMDKMKQNLRKKIENIKNEFY